MTDAQNAPLSHEEALKQLRFYRSEIKDEFALLSNRVGAHISAQSFLIIAYASAMGNLNPQWGHQFRLIFPSALALLGIVNSIQAWLGIRAASDTIALWRLKQHELLKQHSDLAAYHIDRPFIKRRDGKTIDITHERSLIFARWSPLTFIVAWLFFALLALVLNIRL